MPDWNILVPLPRVPFGGRKHRALRHLVGPTAGAAEHRSRAPGLQTGLAVSPERPLRALAGQLYYVDTVAEQVLRKLVHVHGRFAEALPASMQPRSHFLFGLECHLIMSRRSLMVLCVM